MRPVRALTKWTAIVRAWCWLAIPQTAESRPRWGYCRTAWMGILVLAWAALASDLDKVQQLALQRYGQGAVDTVLLWRATMERGNTQSEAKKLALVNDFFNRRMLFESDWQVWQQEDYWATPLEFMGKGAGDCEDFTIAKYVTLLMMGVPKERLRLIYVRARIGGPGSARSEAHMVLGYYAQPTDEPLIMDNLIGTIRPATLRDDLSPVFSFNSDGLWAPGSQSSVADPTARLSRWRDVLTRMRLEGF